VPTENLPVPVLQHPHWRVNFRPASYEKERVKTLDECLEIVRKNRVRMRGWYFPHIGNAPQQCQYGPNWVASWSDAWDHYEYWRFYQSAQFLYLGSVREVTETEWNVRIRRAMQRHVADIDKVPGFLTITEIVFNTTEIFEFAARLTQAEVYKKPLQISVKLTGIRDFMLAADQNRAWSSDYVTSLNEMEYVTSLEPTELVASAAEQAVKCSVWIFERFGWLRPNLDSIKSDQQKLITGRF
jgi:hypothetical protein